MCFHRKNGIKPARNACRDFSLQREEAMNKRITDMVYIAVATALLVVCSWIALPFAIPVTLQTFAVFAILGVLGGRRGTLAIMIYIIMGVIGVPVFSQFKNGGQVFFGIEGGYIVGFFAVALLYWLLEALLGTSLWVRIVSMVAGMLVCYAIGTLWYVNFTLHELSLKSFLAGMNVCVAPFIIPDAIKLTASAFVSQKIKRHVQTLNK